MPFRRRISIAPIQKLDLDGMNTDLTFFTNEPGSTLADRFRKTVKDAQFFDVLVGYFRTSGFHRLHEAMETIEKIRILVGLSIDRQTFEREANLNHFLRFAEIFPDDKIVYAVCRELTWAIL